MSYMSFDKLFAYMDKKGIMGKVLLDGGINRRTYYSMKRNESVTTDTICKVCDILNVKPSQIMEFVKGDPKNDVD